MKIVRVLVVTFCTVLLCAVSAFAEEHQGGEKKEVLLKPVTVTAQKREEDVQKIPMSTSVLSDVAIEDASIGSTHSIQYYVPNLFTANSGSRGYFSRIAIRGVSNTGFGDPGVALYIDDIPYSDLYIFNSPFFDIERIEVLKGPQGTLYGKNTEGGAINVITKKPAKESGGKAGLTFGSFARREVYSSVSFPLIEDTLNCRLATLFGGRNGYIHNTVTGDSVDSEETKIIRGVFTYTPWERLEVIANLGLNKIDDGGFPLVPKDKRRYKSKTGESLKKFEVGNNYEGESDSLDTLSSVKVRYEADTFDFLSISGLRSNSNDLTLDADFSPTPAYFGINGQKALALTQEFRFMSKSGQKDLQWLLGAFYGFEDKDVYTGYVLESNKMKDEMSATLVSQEAALFGQGTWRTFDNKLGLTGGLRFDVAHRYIDKDAHYTFGGVLKQGGYTADKIFVDILPKLAVDYQFTDNIMVYGNFAQGYKAGGYAFAVDAPSLAKFNPEKSNAFEVGLKSEFPEMGLRANLAVFYNYIHNYQDRVQINPTTVIQANSGSMTSRGIELETEYRFMKNWSLLASFGYTNAEYGDYADLLNHTNYKGNKVALFPEYEAGLILQYRNAPGFMGRIEVNRRGATYLERTNSIKQAPYNFCNVKVGYEGEQWDVYLIAENITNEEYFLDGMEDPNLGFVGSTGPPRNVRISASVRF